MPLVNGVKQSMGYAVQYHKRLRLLRRLQMNLTMAIVLMIGGWFLVAAAMLWGVLRVARRHHRPAPSRAPTPKASAPTKMAGAH